MGWGLCFVFSSMLFFVRLVLFCMSLKMCANFLFPFIFDLIQISKEGDDFAVDMEVAKMSELVKGMLDGKIYYLYCV